MKTLIMKIMKNNNSRITFSVVAAVFFILCGFLFVGNELVQNKAYLLRNYEAQQQLVNDELGHYLEQLTAAGKSENEIAQAFIKNELNGSYRWCFISKDGMLLMAKNEDFLEKLNRSGITKDTELLTYLKKQNQIITKESITIDESQYMVGIMSDTKNVLLEWKIKKHSTYLLMALGVICMLFFVSFIWTMVMLGKREKKLYKVEQELSHRNMYLEEMSQEYSLADEKKASSIPMTNLKDYEDELLYSLLNNSKDDKLYPLDIMYIKFLMKDRYYKKDAFMQLMDPVKKMLSPNHIMIEFAKGEFILLLYRTKESKAKEIRLSVEAYLKKEMKEYDMKMVGQHAFISVDYKEKVVLIFEKMRTKMEKEEWK